MSEYGHVFTLCAGLVALALLFFIAASANAGKVPNAGEAPKAVNDAVAFGALLGASLASMLCAFIVALSWWLR